MSLSELAEQIGIPKSSCHAIVATLIARGYLYTLARPRALYPSKRLFDVAEALLSHDPLVARATPLLERLRNASKETVILGKRQGDAVIYLQVLEGLQAVRYTAKPGEYKRLHSSAIGKAVLGGLKDAELRSLLENLALPAITATTLTTPQTLLDDVVQGRRRGYYLTRGENVPDVWAVSATVTLNGQPLAVALAGPQHRMEPNLAELGRLLMATCHLLGRSLAAAQDESRRSAVVRPAAEPNRMHPIRRAPPGSA